MNEYNFNMENIKFAKKKNNMALLQDEKVLYLIARDKTNQEIAKIKVLPISKIKKLTNFFLRGFNIPLEGKSLQEIQIPEKDLMEAERKIIVKGQDADIRVKNAMEFLKERFNGEVNRDTYSRTMVYLETEMGCHLRNNHMIFRLTQEKNDVKSTIHMHNNLPGDKKLILKFFFTETSMPQVINFFRETLSLKAITKSIYSERKEYKALFGEVAFDKVQDNIANYRVIELELDKFLGPNRDSSKVNKVAQEIASQLGLGDCEIVDLGTEAIYEKETGKNFFEVNKIKDREIEE